MATRKKSSLRAMDSARPEACPASGFLVLITNEFPQHLDQFKVLFSFVLDTCSRKFPHQYPHCVTFDKSRSSLSLSFYIHKMELIISEIVETSVNQALSNHRHEHFCVYTSHILS